MPSTQLLKEYDKTPDLDLPPIKTFEEFNLKDSIALGIKDMGFLQPTNIQSMALPYTLGGLDLIGQAQTGTGKTAAFLITIFEKLLKTGEKSSSLPRALIIAPTRELAVQIEKEARSLGTHTDLTFVAVFGGVDYKKQAECLKKGVDIVVGTPGRLIDYMKQDILKTKGIEILVIDEADRLLDMGFIRDLRFMLKRLPKYSNRQTMLFSATINFRVIEATYEYMKIPVEVSATPESITVDEVSQTLYHVEKRKKFRLLLGLVQRSDAERLLIFSNTKSGVMMIEERLTENGIKAFALTGDIPQRKRLKIIERFMGGEIKIVIATDVASRGLHIEDVGYVINYDLPQNPEDYVHRIGRTARAGKRGTAISLASEDDVYYLEPIEKLIDGKLPFVVADDDDFGREVDGPLRKRRPPDAKKRGEKRKSGRKRRG
ncbi:MAG: DEAD/DEAH box helicase [Deltaproteobacteria bacterium]|uniref:DEAD/DEAH box helicase n=1 Tax=Candidatus Zymogenus saltonus TaxID=2844893 RepID=A0A9D8KF81_9DELT|nr:DEAD/DEAH box helicase [Candidatus Zymogenus saltonus]